MADRTNPLLQALAAAMRHNEAVFYARNSFSLSQGPLASEMSANIALDQFKHLVSGEELAELEAFFKARARVGEIVAGLAKQAAESVREHADAVLAAHATPYRNGVYAFYDKTRARVVEVQVHGFDSCYKTADGTIRGSLRVCTRGAQSTAAWSFWEEGGRLVVRSEDDLY